MDNFITVYGVFCLVYACGCLTLGKRFLQDAADMAVIGLGAMLFGGMVDILSQLCNFTF